MSVTIGSEVAVLIYTHKHGEDVSVFLTAELAYQAAAAIVDEWYGQELANREADLAVIRAALEGERWEEAVTSYNAACVDAGSPEWLAIETATVQGLR